MQHPKRSLLSSTLLLPIGVNVVLASLSCITPRTAKAQITPDGTLGDRGSVVLPDNLNGNPIDRINGGAIQGSNLFHSFTEFNVNQGARTYFTNPGGINNILTRVTGVNASNILGTLGVLGNANFFLINPHGIVFGPNARLDVGGSFVASTADSIVFDRGFEFSATNPQAPLLTVNIPLALQLRQNPASIVNQSSAVLALQPGNTLGLIGGNVILDGGSLQVSGGRIELGGLASAGTVGLNIQESQGVQKLTSLRFPNTIEQADISLSNQSIVNVAGGGGGSIVSNGRNISVLGGSRLLAGIAPGLGSLGTQAGNIEINATGKVVFDGVSNGFISGALNQVEVGATGNAGRIEINANNVEVKNGGQLNTSTTGKGNAGTIQINATDKVVFSGAPLGFRSSAFSQVGKNAEGDSGGIEINANSVEVTDGGYLEANSIGQGNAGTIRITARDRVLFDGESTLGFRSSVFSQVEENAVGNSGGIKINAGSVEVTNGAQLSATTLASGDAGKIQITASDRVLFDGESTLGFLSSVFSQVGENAIGNSGGIEINAGSVEVTNGAQLSATTEGLGNSGLIRVTAADKVIFDGESSSGFRSSATSQVFNGAEGKSGGIDIHAGDVEITNGALLDANTLGKGDSGTIRINARDRVLFDGESHFGFLSAALSQVQEKAEGNSGGIDIHAGNVEITNGALLDANTLGKGDSGTIRINARDRVLFDGESRFGFLSAAFSQVEEGAEGKSGGIDIHAGDVEITNGALLDANTLGKGDSGTIRINARDRVVLDGQSHSEFLSSLFSQVGENAIGNSGGIEINARSVEVTNGAQLNALTQGAGNSGLIQVTTADKVIFDGESPSGFRSSATSQVFTGAEGKSGGINIHAGDVEITNGALLDANTLGKGDSGTIRINARDRVLFDGESHFGFLSAALSQVQEKAEGNSGGIDIHAGNVDITNGALLDASTLGRGNAGAIQITGRERVVFAGESQVGNGSSAISQVTDSAVGNSGGIAINAGTLEVTKGAELTTTTQGVGNSGTIQITANNGVVFDGTSRNGSRISAATSEVGFGAAGDSEGIQIYTPSFRVTNGAFVSANTNGNGNAGNIEVTANTIELSNAGQIRTSTSASSKAGNITLNAQNRVFLTDLGTAILAQTEKTSTSAGGNIFVVGSPENVLIQNGAQLSVNSKGTGTGGDISLQANSMTLDGGTISAETAKERGGNISLDIADLLLMQGDSKITTNAGIESQPGAIGTGGNIAINTQFLVAPPSRPHGSDITANATYGNGGRVDITANGIFGIEFRDRERDFFNDITASSEFGGNPGVVNINQTIDPSQNLVELPTNVIDPNDQIAQNPCSQGLGSEFIITGRGGLPPSPNEDLSQEATQVGLVEPVSSVSNVKPTPKNSSTYSLKSQIPSPIVPAQGWIFNDRGEIVLTAYNPNVTGTHRLPKNLGSCSPR
ncbi:filamentous hemagglutinin N-terminal domain-containing protein [Nostoc sp. C117]|uniref:two-partner secretion domain-containing protein n=1 Tax=Nostoc sp. C117 TaxID=3349875 RepID=UPI00370D7701